MTDPANWGDAGSQIIWSWYMARAAYHAITGGIAVAAILGIVAGGLLLLKRIAR